MSERPMARRLRKLRALPSGFAATGDRLLLYLSRIGIRSELPIDIVIPVAPKDLDVLPVAVAGARRNVRHPVGAVYIVAPDSPVVRSLCNKIGCIFVDESSLVDMDPRAIGLRVSGVDRSTWIYQQFLKWSGDAIARSGHFLVIDADTVFVTPQVFERNGKIIFNYSDEYNQPYYDMFKRLLGASVQFPCSFVSHQMLFDCQILAELKRAIEDLHQCVWTEAILKTLDRSQWSGFSDYDTYGQYVFLSHPRSMAIEYWSNLNLVRSRELRSATWLSLCYGGRYKSVSFHSYSG